MDYERYAVAARSALITAAMRRTTLTYGELAMAIELPENVPLPHHINRVLRSVSEECIARGEPSLAVIVVNRQTGEPGKGFVDGPSKWFGEAQQCFRKWRSPA